MTNKRTNTDRNTERFTSDILGTKIIRNGKELEWNGKAWAAPSKKANGKKKS